MNDLRKFIRYYKPYRTVLYLDLLCAMVISLIDLAFLSAGASISDADAVSGICGKNHADAAVSCCRVFRGIYSAGAVPLLRGLSGARNGREDGAGHAAGAVRTL